MKTIHIALAGNPNAGKTSIFNSLTGSHQHVGNWPGKTVEKKEGFFLRDETEFRLVDLPGTYSLSAYSPEEVIARDYIINEKPDVVVVVVDAANLERNLYLAVQVLELEVPVVLAHNMMDVAESRGHTIDLAKISSSPHVPVVQTVARRAKGLDALVEIIQKVAEEPATYDYA